MLFAVPNGASPDTVTADPMPHTRLCGRCDGVLPARTNAEYTGHRADALLRNGLCVCDTPSPDLI